MSSPMQPYDSGALRKKIEGELGAQGPIQATPSRAIKPFLDPDLYAKRHKVENFFQRIKRFCRIALRCEKTLAGFMGWSSSSQPSIGSGG